MNPDEFAPEDLMLWQDALVQQREAEARLVVAIESQMMSNVMDLVREVDTLRTVADLLLAEAVQLKCDSDSRHRDRFVRRVSAVDTGR